MLLKKRFKILQTPSRVLFTVTAALTLCSFSDCGTAPVEVKDAQFCAPVPGNLGAVCDNFLTANQQILTQPNWEALQRQWVSQGQAVECTTSQTLGDFKSEIEKLCSVATCDYPTKTKIIEGLNKIQELGRAPVLYYLDEGHDSSHD